MRDLNSRKRKKIGKMMRMITKPSDKSLLVKRRHKASALSRLRIRSGIYDYEIKRIRKLERKFKDFGDVFFKGVENGMELSALLDAENLMYYRDDVKLKVSKPLKLLVKLHLEWTKNYRPPAMARYGLDEQAYEFSYWIGTRGSRLPKFKKFKRST